MDNNKPFVSIVIPTRDRVDLLVVVLEFIQRQTFKNFEVIISDNGINEPCFERVQPYLKDKRFSYKRPETPLSMCDHWNFAIEGAKGEYLSVFNEKFILRRDALEILFRVFKESSPDVMNWQFDYFEAKEFSKGNGFRGTFHPRIKPRPLKQYDNVIELERRFSFQYPTISRKNNHLDSYGKVYGGLVKLALIERIKHHYDCVFYPGSPDFTSMIAILNEGETFIDISQSLMLLLNKEGTSNGVAVSKNAEVAWEALNNTFSNMLLHMNTLPIKGCWIGIENHIAKDYQLMKDLATSGPVKSIFLDRVALAVWVKQSFELIEDWGQIDCDAQKCIIESFISTLSVKDKLHFETISDNITQAQVPNSIYIYHSGVRQVSDIKYGLSAKSLALLHWRDRVANPALNISLDLISLDSAEEYLYEYNLYSREILNIK